MKEVINRFPERVFSMECGVSNAVVLADQFLLQIAINNLLDNAVKYSSKNTTINVGLQLKKQNILIIYPLLIIFKHSS